MVRRSLCIAMCLTAALLPAQENPEAKIKAATPMVGTYYFYWYRHPDAHFANPDGSDSMIQHFERPESVDYADPAFHRAQIESMMAAGLDFFLPVYWGIPDRPQRQTWSDVGLRAIVRALQDIREAGGEPPKIGMFYDTTTLLNSERGDGESGTIDLRKPAGKAIFEDTVLAFFKLVPQDLRFELDGYPMAVLYASFGAPHDRDLLEGVDDRFFGLYNKRLFFIAEESWRVRSHARYRWGSALLGPTGDSIVRTLGPGYDDTRVPGRGTPIREREDTRFYQWSWQQALLANPTIVLIETWNEFHEGSGIAPCVEHGDRYLKVTRRYVKRLKRRMLPDTDELVRLVNPEPRPRPDTGWFQPEENCRSVFFRPDHAREGLLGEGLRLVPQADGKCEHQKLGTREVIVSTTAEGGISYLYFGIADEFAYRDLGGFEIEVEFITGPAARIQLQYDSWDQLAPHDGAYRDAPRLRLDASSLPDQKTAIWTLPDARFMNRQNGAADFRFAIQDAPVTIRRVTLRRLDERPEGRPTLRTP
ncbi:MAG: DUF5010 domain-containing protein [Planctomycetes bacterium]|nr:DUF5010 domain-containing protein [Planctomycetota bacterium]